MDNQNLQLDRCFHALADPTRMAVIDRLCSGGAASVGELAQPFDMALPSFMKHLHVLESCGLIETSKVGRVRNCRIRADAMKRAADWLTDRRALWERRLDRLEDYLAAKHQPSKKGEPHE